MIDANQLLDNIKKSEDPKAAVDALNDAELIEVIKLALTTDKKITQQVTQLETLTKLLTELKSRLDKSSQQSVNNDNKTKEDLEKNINELEGKVSSRRTDLKTALHNHVDPKAPKAEAAVAKVVEKSKSANILDIYDEAIQISMMACLILQKSIS